MLDTQEEHLKGWSLPFNYLSEGLVHAEVSIWSAGPGHSFVDPTYMTYTIKA